MQLVAIPGALRTASTNRKLLRLAVRHAEGAGAKVETVDLRELALPLYDGDVEAASGVPEAAKAFAAKLSAADGFLIASPEYNFSVPAALKNLIDWTSRLRGQPWRGKPGLLMSASLSLVGGNRGLWHLRVPLEVLGAQLHPDMFSLAKSHEAFDDAGELVDASLAKRLAAAVDDFLRIARALKA
ncbi:MAG TPA: NAD(P)H-dependent oxidoreductase [Myxococcota bacterium]|jgi:NAD(P)H-dependent FMN reductase|nr:NAD(P)H-dependent oxidoreductase [Myxococcota bacterium]